MAWNGRMMRWVVAAGFFMALDACEEARSPAPAPVKSTPVAASKPAPVSKPTAPAPAKTGKLSEISLEEFLPLQQAGTALIFDARPSFVAAFGKIPGAINWPRYDFDHSLSTHEPEIAAAKKAGRIVVIYCTDAGCPDSHKVAERLVARGHDVSVLQGGYGDWKAAGLPTE